MKTTMNRVGRALRLSCLFVVLVAGSPRVIAQQPAEAQRQLLLAERAQLWQQAQALDKEHKTKEATSSRSGRWPYAWEM